MKDNKFRVWDTEKNIMLYLNDCERNLVIYGDNKWYLRDETITLLDHNSGILMQYTGLKDNYGIKVYDGDILDATIRENSLATMGKVIFDKHLFAYCNKNDSGSTMLWRLKHIKIIGNIYENPGRMK